MKKQAIAIVSGGLDSVTLAHMLHHEGYALHLLSFNYGQRHKKELTFAKRCAVALGAQHSIINLATLGKHLGGSSLTDMSIPVPEGHYADVSMRATVVPNRNAIMLAIAYGVAVAEGAIVIGLGVHAGDHPIYPDCRPTFIEAFDRMEMVATEGYSHADLHLYAPFVHWQKDQIVKLGAELHVDYRATWSCYAGGKRHCGRCGTCVERRQAFDLAGVKDPTRYEVAHADNHSPQ